MISFSKVMRTVTELARSNIFRTPEISQMCSNTGKTEKQLNLRVTGFAGPLPEPVWLSLIPRASDCKLPWRQSVQKSSSSNDTGWARSRYDWRPTKAGHLDTQTRGNDVRRHWAQTAKHKPRTETGTRPPLPASEGPVPTPASRTETINVCR